MLSIERTKRAYQVDISVLVDAVLSDKFLLKKEVAIATSYK